MTQNNNLLTWYEPHFGIDEAKAVADVVKSGFINEGKISYKFAQEIQKYLGVKYAVPNSNGTVSLFLALKASGIGVGDEVIVPGLSFIATANAVILAGAKPVFAEFQIMTVIF